MQKGYVTIVLSVLLLAIFGTIGYIFIQGKKSPSSVQIISSNNPTISPTEPPSTSPGGNTKNIQFGQVVELKEGEIARTDQPDFSAQFVRVIQDNRCPPNAKCKMAGGVSVLLRINKDGIYLKDVTLTMDPSKLELSTVQFFPAAGAPSTTTYEVKLVEVRPNYISIVLLQSSI